MKLLSVRNGLATLAVVTAISYPINQAAAGTEFLVYEGRDAVQDGQGGNKKIVDGVDFWIHGTPPHRFQVLGMISDERWASGIYGLMQVSSLEHDIAKRTRAAGGDAVILQDSHNNVWGVSGSTFGSASYGNHSAFGSSFSTESPYGTRATSYVVVKYLPDAPVVEVPEAAPPSPLPQSTPPLASDPGPAVNSPAAESPPTVGRF